MEPAKEEITDKMEKLKVEEEEEKKELPEEKKGEEEVQIGEGIQDWRRNQESAFLSSSTSWDDEKLAIPEKIKQALRDAEVLRPSKIQAYAIPLVTEDPERSIVAQSQNGSGKTFAFSLCSLLRIDENDSNLQVLVLAHTRELVNQIWEQIQILNKYTKYNITQVKKEEKKPTIGQITVMTAGKCKTLMKLKKINFSSIKMIVIDEADHFFGSEEDRAVTTRLIQEIDEKCPKVQKLFFSATYEEHVRDAIRGIIPESSISIKVKSKKLTLKGVKQLYFVAKEVRKFNVVEDLYNEFDNTQMIVFVNTKKFGEMAHAHMTGKGYKSSIITGNVDPEERDRIMAQFRNRELQFIFATNVLSRGIDISDMKLMINLDVPFIKDADGFENADYENYLHRIGRTGRFDTKGVALTIIDGSERRFDKEMDVLKQIQEHYESNIEELKNIEDLPEIYNEHCNND
ncbi:unnamed protein product [Moneuplotes crassus]|uniref:RNA helicase n=2 Tax=Euplotes crassus TaxID=5936 RepID=A0AAD1UI22_EUPCR|nr:unnamed protein product [Moneuplotes crassus]